MPSIKDSGKRVQMAGMIRDTTDDKIRYDLALDGPMFRRWAEHLTAGAKKYSARNWMGAKSQEELDRFRESALRHFIQWFNGEVDEDHAAAVLFNINGAEYVADRMLEEKEPNIKAAPADPGRTGPADRRKCQDVARAMAEQWRRTSEDETGRRATDETSYAVLPNCKKGA